MTHTQHNWIPTRADSLRVGHFIRIDHHWFDHPFARSIFEITAASEIEIIQRAGLTRICVDFARSRVQSRAEVHADPVNGQAPETTRASAELLEKKASVSRQLQSIRDSVSLARVRYQAAVEAAQALLMRVLARDAASFAATTAHLSAAAEVAATGNAPLTLVETPRALQSSRRLAMQGNDAVSLCAAMAGVMALDAVQASSLLAAAALHVVGCLGLEQPPGDEAPGLCRPAPAQLQYPHTGAALLQECGMPEDVVRIVREHCERPDGEGFPAGLQGASIHPLALVLGTVREFQVRAAAGGSSPARALAHMFNNMRPVYGEEPINCLVAAVGVFPPGTNLLLSNGSIGRVLRVNTECRMRPVVGVLFGACRPEELEILDLAQEKDLMITRVVEALELPAPLREQEQERRLGLALSPLQHAATRAVAA